MSFGLELEPGKTVPDGDSLFTLFMDWSSTQYDILNVVAGNQSGLFAPVGTDDYNGITVAMSAKNADGVFRNVALSNRFTMDYDPVGPRTATDLVAPGVQLDVAGANGVFLLPPDDSGTSFAAPHVTGTVALLQQYGEERIDAPGSGWASTALRHEVMKVVLMNSADKIQGTLGMHRTLLDQAGNTWLQSEAYLDNLLERTDPLNGLIPLDDQMGTGHLNATRALQQYAPGEFDAGGAAVPPIGWDYGFTLDVDDVQTYALAQALPANQFVSLTLAWDRDVVFENDIDGDNEYDPGDTFLQPAVPTDMNLYLMPAGATTLGQYVARSIATDTSVEHIFFLVPTEGMYEIWVEQASGALFGAQSYALAWWTLPLPATTGDYDGDGEVTIADYATWKAAYGSIVARGTGADGNSDGRVDGGDYVYWRNRLATGGSGAGGLAGVPEPSVLLTLFVAVVIERPRRRNRNPRLTVASSRQVRLHGIIR